MKKKPRDSRASDVQGKERSEPAVIDVTSQAELLSASSPADPEPDDG